MASRELTRTKAAWNRRASRDAFHYVETNLGGRDRERFFAVGEERARLLIDPVLEKLGPAGRGRAVDLGCGTGRFTRALARRFAEVVGVDVAEGMIEQARRQCDAANATFLAGDGAVLPVADQSADFVWSYECFQHMSSHAVQLANLREVRRVLRPGGSALIHFRTGYTYPVALWWLARLLPDPLIAAAKRLLGKDPLTADKAWRGARPLSPAGIRALAGKAGLGIVEIRDDPTHPAGSRAFALLRP